MADVEAPAAAPSPAAPAPPPADAPVSVPRDPEAYAEWRQTGKLPDPKPSKDDSATSKKSADQESGKGAPVPETGSKRQERGNADSRKEELNREIRELLAKRDDLRREAESGSKKDVKAESSPARDVKAEPSPAEAAPKRPVKPKRDDYDSWDAYEAADDKYSEDLAEYKAEERLQAFVQRQQQELQSKQMQERLDAANARYGQEAAPQIIDTAKTIFEDKAVARDLKTAMGRSDVLVDALYVMGSDPDELSSYLDLARKDPLEALRKWFTVEALVREELAKGQKAPAESPPRGPDGKFLQPAKVKSPPAPPVELNGSASPPGDERERAAAAGNFRSFKQEADRRDMQRLRGN